VSIPHTFSSSIPISSRCRGCKLQRRRMALPNKSPYSFGNSWRGCVVQADLVEWEERLHFFSRVPRCRGSPNNSWDVWNEKLRELTGRLSLQQRPRTSELFKDRMASYSRDVLFLGNVDEKIGFHELYTQFSLASPSAMQRYVFVAVAQQMSARDERVPHRFRSSIVYRYSGLRMSFPKQPWKLVGAFLNI
jgi:hypothetical protein